MKLKVEIDLGTWQIIRLSSAISNRVTLFSLGKEKSNTSFHSTGEPMKSVACFHALCYVLNR